MSRIQTLDQDLGQPETATRATKGYYASYVDLKMLLAGLL